MIVLREIKRTADTISAKYYPENDPRGGFLCLNLSDGSVKEHIPDGNYYKDYAPLHAKRKLMSLAQMENVPKESRVMWY